MKHCTKCRVRLNLANCYCVKSGRFVAQCKKCYSDRNRKRREKNIPRDKQLQKEWREKNRERKRQLDREWNLVNNERARESKRAYYRRNIEKIRAGVAVRGRKTRYNLTDEQYQKMLNEQGRKCAICKEQKRLCVDHCHKTGKIRGLLCFGCNLDIRILEGPPEKLRSAQKYLRTP